MILEITAALGALLQGRELHSDPEERPHWRLLGLAAIVLGGAALVWLLVTHKGRLFGA